METSKSTSAPDLTQRPPRSPRLQLGGYVLLPRILDKGRALLAGKLGEYHYNGKGMDRHFFNFTGLDHETLKEQIAKGGGDGDLLAWILRAYTWQTNLAVELGRRAGPWTIQLWTEPIRSIAGVYQQRRGDVGYANARRHKVGDRLAAI